MSLPRSTTQLVLPDAYISTIELGKLPPPPPISNFAVPLIYCGLVVCVGAGAIVYQICKDSLSGKPITCPIRVDVPLGIARTVDALFLAKCYAEWLAAILACELVGGPSLEQCMRDAAADFLRKTGIDVFDYQLGRGRGMW